MIYREQSDATLINAIANLPEVRPHFSYHGKDLDFSPVLNACVFLTNGEDAVGIFEERGADGPKPGVWQAHTMFAPTCRGSKALTTARAMLDHMKPHATAIWGTTPIKNKAARWFNRKLGFVAIGFDTYEAEGPVELFLLRT